MGELDRAIMSDDDVSEEKTKALAEKQKAKGNAAFSKGDNKVALRHYSMAINLDPENAVYYSNRSAAHAGLADWNSCLEDSHKTIELRPEWFKGYTRLAFGFSGLKMYKCAEEQYEKAASFLTPQRVSMLRWKRLEKWLANPPQPSRRRKNGW